MEQQASEQPLDAHTPAEATSERAADKEMELQARVEQLEAALTEAETRYLRALADFQNFQKRAWNNEQQARAEGVAKVISAVVGVIDHFDLALTQDTSKATAEQIVGGVRVIRDELLKALQMQGVGVINPGPGEEFVPGRHEAIMQQAVDGVEAGRVAATFQAGYTINVGASERVIRPAKVSVAG